MLNNPPVDYPLLGEPSVIEFVNTQYVDPDGAFDFLGTTGLAGGWFEAVNGVFEAITLTERQRCDLIGLRAAVRAAFADADQGDLVALQAAVNAAPGRRVVELDDAGAVCASTVFDTSTADGAMAKLAHDAIEILVGAHPRSVLVCDRPACNMRYFQHHRRRRYCNPLCANADRQRRFQHKRKIDS